MSEEAPSRDESTIELRGMEEAPSVYANYCVVRSTPEEVMLHFGQRSINNPTQGNTVITVYTSLWHAKRLAKALLESIGKYEAVFGEIPIDPIAALDPETLKKLGVTDDDS